MKVFQYPVSRFPFHKWIKELGFHEFTTTYLNPTDEAMDVFYEDLIKDPQFMELHGKYLRYVAPFFDSQGLKPHPLPLVRFHQSDCPPFYANVVSGLLAKGKTFIYTPLTPMIYTNSFAMESQRGLGDFSFVNMKIGDFYICQDRYKLSDLYHNGMRFTSVSLVSIFV